MFLQQSFAYIFDALVLFSSVLSYVVLFSFFFFFFKQKTAYEMRISDWSSDVCSSDLWRGISSFSSSQSWRPRVSARPEWTMVASASTFSAFTRMVKIGRASCRERVCQYV